MFFNGTIQLRGVERKKNGLVAHKIQKDRKHLNKIEKTSGTGDPPPTQKNGLN